MSYAQISLLSFISVAMSGLVSRLNSFDGASNGSTLLIGFVNVTGAASLLILVRRLGLTTSLPVSAYRLFGFNFVWGGLSFLFGMFTAQDYWGWKVLLLSHLFTIVIPLAIIIGVQFDLFLKIFRFVSFVVFPIGLLLVPYALMDDAQLVPRLVAPVMLFMLVGFYISPRWCAFFLLIGFASIAIDFSYRTNLIRFTISASLLAILIFRVKGVFRIWQGIVLGLFLLPLVLLALGITDQFNIFRDNAIYFDVVSRKDKVVEVMDMNVDTRTFLYVEVFNSMLRRGSSFLIGEGGAAGYDTDAFLDADLNGQGRHAAEVGFLNILLHQGIVGVALYGAILVVSCVTAMRSSNNALCKVLGLFLMTRWVLLFVEDMPQFDVINYINWVVVGLCLSSKFRALTDDQLRVQFSTALKSPFRRA